jgi:hypothetical protein
MLENSTGNVKFVILSEEEETSLVDDINARISDERVCAFRVIKRGYASGIWRKVEKSSCSDGRFLYLPLTNPRTVSTYTNTPKCFGMCISSDFLHLAAVDYTRQGIQRILYFPKGIYSDWKYLWKGYQKSVSDLLLSLFLLRILKKSGKVGEITPIAAYLVPRWATRILPLSDTFFYRFFLI